jgi:ABC-type lipoprotein release transport system permease subunit
MKITRMAWRNIWRNRRRTAVTTGAMALALFVTILYSGLVDGLLVNMERDLLDYEVGDIQVFARGYQDAPSLFTSMEDAGSLVTALNRAGLPSCARLIGTGLAAAGDSSAGVQLRGIDVERDAAVLALAGQVARGEWLSTADPAGVVLGRRLAEILEVNPGDSVVVVSQATDGSIANDLYRVRGILRGIGEAADRSAVCMTAGAFRELMSMPAGAHQVIVRRPKGMSLEAAAAAVRTAAPGRDVMTWRQLIPTLATMMDSMRGLIVVMFLIVYIAIAIVILNAMLMSVFERIREFGVLKAVGAGPGTVLSLILLESVMQMGVAISAGVLLSLPALWYLARTGIDMGKLAGVSFAGLAMSSRWTATVSPSIFLTPVFLLVLVVSAAVLYPAFKAALIRPVEAMRHS